MVSANVSSRLKAIRLPLIVGVVFIHAYSTQVLLGGGQRAGAAHVAFSAFFIRNLISQGIARIAVPMFFLMSGFLFFQGYDGTPGAYKQKLRRRLRTLLLPFLIWNAATLALYAIGEALPSTRVYFANKYWPAVRDFGVLDYANALLGLTTKYPMSYQFWFIRDLMALVILAPLFYLLLKRRLVAIPFLFLLLGIWMWGGLPLAWPQDEAILFFAAGSYFAIGGVDVCALDRRRVLTGILFATLLVVDAATGGAGRFFYLHKAMILSGLPFLWWLAQVAVNHAGLRSWLFRLSASSFFVYAAHEPPLSILRKSAFRIFSPTSSVAQIFLYFLIPITLIAVLVVCSEILARWFPSVMAVITGAETKRPPGVEARGGKVNEASPMGR